MQQQVLAPAVRQEAKLIKLPLEGSAGTGYGLDPDLPIDPSTGVIRRAPPASEEEVVKWYEITN